MKNEWLSEFCKYIRGSTLISLAFFKVDGVTMAPAAVPLPSIPSVSPAMSEIPGLPLSDIAAESANSALGPPSPEPKTFTVHSPPESSKMGLSSEHCEKVYTSGEAALTQLNNFYKKSKFYHIGPPRDFDLFKSFEKNKVDNIDECTFLLCTGLFDDYLNDLIYYKNLLKNKNNLKMICTNPDLVVDRGEKREYCAGTIASIFEEVGGEVEYFGKPYPLVYTLSAKVENKKILCIGDNLNTDIKGANNQNFSSLFISSGIHKNENNFDELFKKYGLSVNYFQSSLKW